MNIKRWAISLAGVLLILTILTFFKEAYLFESVLATIVITLMNGILLLASSLTIINETKYVYATLGSLFILLGGIPLALGYDLVGPEYVINMPLLLGQILAIITSVFNLYVLLRKAHNKLPKSF